MPQGALAIARFDSSTTGTSSIFISTIDGQRLRLARLRKVTQFQS
jgi:hypothetical protein